MYIRMYIHARARRYAIDVLEQFRYFLKSRLERYIAYQDLGTSLFADLSIFFRCFDVGPKQILQLIEIS